MHYGWELGLFTKRKVKKKGDALGCGGQEQDGQDGEDGNIYRGGEQRKVLNVGAILN